MMGKKRKQSRCLSLGEWRNKRWLIHTAESCLAIKRDEALIHATTQTTLSERSQEAMIRLIGNVSLKQGKSIQKADWWMPGAGGRGGLEMEPLQMGKWDLLGVAQMF